jgi:hypothetical protein
MPASRDSSSSAASSLDPLGDLLAATRLRGPPSGEAPLSSRARSSTTVGAAAAAPPPTSCSLPASSAGTKRLGGVHGHTKGKDSLFCYGSSKDGLLCAGYVGGKGGARRRFCCKSLDIGAKHCGDKAHSAKFPLILESYYIKMEGETALCAPMLRMSDLIHFNSLSLASQSHTLREWEISSTSSWVKTVLIPI